MPKRKREEERRNNNGPCYEHQRGNCRFGASCVFSHSMTDKDDMVEVFINEDRKQSREEKDPASPKSESPRRQRSPFRESSLELPKSEQYCPDLDSGHCRLGENCDFSHERLRTRVCYDFKNGQCNWGKYCNFSHEGVVRTYGRT